MMTPLAQLAQQPRTIGGRSAAEQITHDAPTVAKRRVPGGFAAE
jgi:hypothetical protein